MREDSNISAAQMFKKKQTKKNPGCINSKGEEKRRAGDRSFKFKQICGAKKEIYVYIYMFFFWLLINLPN